MKEIIIQNTKIGKNHKPFIIAEMSGNHNQSLEKALSIVDAAATAGAQALKLQTYTADTMTLDIDSGAFKIEDSKSLWNDTTLYKLFQQAYTPWEWHEAIFARCQQHGMIGFSTPFDSTAVDFLEKLGVPLYKIASFENTDLPLIRKIAATGKPMIISTGLASIAELDETVRTAKASGCRDIVLLKCTSSYPANPSDSNIVTIPHMEQLFDVQVGLSDHTMGLGAAVASVAMGATVIEKHFTLARSEGGVDSAFSLEPEEMKSLVTETERAWQAMGSVKYGPTENEKASMQFRRSLYVVQSIKSGEAFNASNVRAIRPGLGLAPKFLDIVIGKTAATDLKVGTPLSWDIIR